MVIGLSGVAGVGEKKVVVPWSELKFAPVTEAKKNAITMDEAKLESAPRYDRTAARSDVAPAASPRAPACSPVKDSDRGRQVGSHRQGASGPDQEVTDWFGIVALGGFPPLGAIRSQEATAVRI